jgi:hypothetical protein
MAITLSGDNGITFPNSTIQASAGQVLQVVQSVLTTPISTSSGSAVTTGLSATITPKFASSKIMLFVGGNIDTGAANRQAEFFIFRNASSLNTFGFTMGYSGADRLQTPLFIGYLDSPATTSSTTYTLYFAITSGSGAIVFNGSSGIGSNIGTFTLMEIAA